MSALGVGLKVQFLVRKGVPRAVGKPVVQVFLFLFRLLCTCVRSLLFLPLCPRGSLAGAGQGCHL